MEQSELEEGEISDSGDEVEEINGDCGTEVASVVANRDYTSIPRPSNPALSYREPKGLAPSAYNYRDRPEGRAADSDDAADSDGSADDETSSKRSRLQPEHPPQPTQPEKQKKRNVWSDVLLEQHISNRIKSSGNIETEDVDTVERGVESYKPSGESRTVAFETLQQDAEVEQGEIWDVNDDGESVDTIRRRVGERKSVKESVKESVKDRLDLNYYDEDGFSNYDQLEALPEEVTAEDDERVVARYIARNLGEPKTVLTERVARFAGRQKALELYHATLDIESAGGMMTMNGDTRRTPGGVFLQLLKKDKSITKDTVKEIFAIDRENQKFAKKVIIKDRQMRKRKYYAKQTTAAAAIAATAATSSSTTDQMESSDDFALMTEPQIQIGVDS